MDPLEKKLNAMPLAAQSAELDRRMDDAFRTARQQQKASPGTRYWWMATAAAASGIAATLLVVLMQRSPATPETVVYEVEASGLMRELLLSPAAGRDHLPDFVVPANVH